MRIVLCDERHPKLDINVKAELIKGELKIAGEDLSKACKESFGTRTYEYYYDFDRANTSKLFKSLDRIEGENDLDVLLRCYNGSDGCMKLREHCKENDIEYTFTSY
ncbi:MAG: hypothetical protein GX078_00590 [Clostridiales bacterium]|jgi:hypothetical protein|nr:hypothetical protein [Clostridiales bacterium]